MRVIAAVLLCLFALPAFAADVEGAADHPLVGRFEGSEINHYDTRDFDEYRFHAAKPPAKPERIEGVTTRIAYTMPENVSLAEVARNFRLGLEGKGFEMVWECETDDCGGGDLGYALDLFPLPHMSLDIFNYRYLAAKRTADGAETYATVAFSAVTSGRIQAQVTVVETATLDNKMIDAAAIGAALSDTGRVALYGIYFDTDKAEVKPESAPTLTEMAGFLQAEPALEVVIVGHTDNQGALDYNLSLSHRRASAVRDALIAGHGIDGARLTSAGAGFLAPVALNGTEAGRALNRRVELIVR